MSVNVATGYQRRMGMRMWEPVSAYGGQVVQSWTPASGGVWTSFDQQGDPVRQADRHLDADLHLAQQGVTAAEVQTMIKNARAHSTPTTRIWITGQPTYETGAHLLARRHRRHGAHGHARQGGRQAVRRRLLRRHVQDRLHQGRGQLRHLSRQLGGRAHARGSVHREVRECRARERSPAGSVGARGRFASRVRRPQMRRASTLSSRIACARLRGRSARTTQSVFITRRRSQGMARTATRYGNLVSLVLSSLITVAPTIAVAEDQPGESAGPARPTPPPGDVVAPTEAAEAASTPVTLPPAPPPPPPRKSRCSIRRSAWARGSGSATASRTRRTSEARRRLHGPALPGDRRPRPVHPLAQVAGQPGRHPLHASGKREHSTRSSPTRTPGSRT